MSAFPGSSPIPIYSSVVPAPIGLRGDTGPTGPIGITGDALTGRTGPTGQGIVAVFYASSGISFENFNGSEFYVQFSGNAGTSFVNGVPQSIIVAKGLTSGPPATRGYSVLYSFVNLFESTNQVSIQPNFSGFDPSNDEIALKIRSFESSGGALVGLSADGSYLYLVGRTYSFNAVGNTGEILYKANNLMFAVDGSNYNASTELLSVPLAADRHPIHNNQNIGTPTYTFSNQNISGASGATGFAFFSVNYGQFGLNNNNYQLVEDPAISQVTLNLGVTGSDNLTFKFIKNTFNENSIFNPQYIESDDIGSCCFCESGTTEIGCLDYVSRGYCNSVGGSFSTTPCIERISSGDCYAEGACCVNGKCINSSLEKCLQYNGTFFPGEICSGERNAASSFTCPDTCPGSVNTGRCCYKGYCFDLTNVECSQIPGAVFTNGVSCISETSDPSCCQGLAGACCRKVEGEYICEQQLPAECSALGGIFHGAGSSCVEVECCGSNFIQNYFNASTDCRANTVQPCLPIGTKVGGGYLVGIIGMPSPCSSYGNPLGAYGQPLICRVLPRGRVSGSGAFTWNLKNCGGANGAVLGSLDALAADVNIEYFVRTKSSIGIDLDYQNNAVNNCLLKYGVPYIQQTLTDSTIIEGTATTVRWNDPIQYVGSTAYNASNGRFAYPLGGDIDLNYLIPESSQYSDLYRELASQYYGENSVHMLWALIVAPEDAYGGNNLVWGMSEGRARPEGFNNEPITTFAVDGLLSTRMFDETSKTNPRLWFRGGGNTDLKAYDRFAFFNTNVTKRSNWNFSVVESAIETDIEVFSQKYSEMWESNNAQNSCTRQISILNQQEYLGYNDWYIPSIIELNYINNNIVDLNNQMLLNGDTPINLNNSSDYWSSTSVCYLKSWSSSDYLDYTSYRLQEVTSNATKNSTFIFNQSNFAGLNDKTAYELSLNVCAGENMLTQKFASDIQSSSNAGLVISKRRSDGEAKLRPVRRIPIVVGCVNENILQLLQPSYFSSCESCPGNCSPSP